VRLVAREHLRERCCVGKAVVEEVDPHAGRAGLLRGDDLGPRGVSAIAGVKGVGRYSEYSMKSPFEWGGETPRGFK
jgi:hypothetical protein